jgi:hypothetical protein
MMATSGNESALGLGLHCTAHLCLSPDRHEDLHMKTCFVYERDISALGEVFVDRNCAITSSSSFVPTLGWKSLGQTNKSRTAAIRSVCE